MSAMSEACPVCGTPTQCHETEVIPPQHTDKYVISSDVKVLKGLRDELDMLVGGIQSNPQNTYCITTADGKIKGHEFLIDWGLYNALALTNIVNVIIQFSFNKTEEMKFKSLDNACLYRSDSGGGYSLEVGDDLDMAAYLFSEVVRKVWSFEGELEFDSFSEPNKYDDIKLMLSAENTSEIAVLVKQYNTEAKENGYPSLEIDTENDVFKGSFPMDKKVGGFLSKSGRIHKKMKADFEKILDLCLTSLVD
jgi:hypothetical protein